MLLLVIICVLKVPLNTKLSKQTEPNGIEQNGTEPSVSRLTG